jgi:vacuolar-type H+-ATPase subunit E/Vma4
MDIEKKLKNVEDNCINLAQKDADELKKATEKERDEKIADFISKYKEELDMKLNKEMANLNKNYNHSIFTLKKEGQIKLENFKKSKIRELKNKILDKYNDYKNTEEYKYDLISRIKATMGKAGEGSRFEIMVVENDYNNYIEMLKNEFVNIDIKQLSNDYIGGCIIFNKDKKMLIDNTIRTVLEEELGKVVI